MDSTRATPHGRMRSMNARAPFLAIGLGAAALLALAAGCGGAGSTAPHEHAIVVTDDGFQPRVTQVPRGEPVTLVVTRKSDHTCATDMVFAALDTSYDLPLDRTVRIQLPATRGDTLSYACPMGMFTGMVVTK